MAIRSDHRVHHKLGTKTSVDALKDKQVKIVLPRPALHILHPNTSMHNHLYSDNDEFQLVRAGSKRKRTANARPRIPPKRRKSVAETSEMEWKPEDEEEQTDPEEGDDQGEDPADDFLLTSAPKWQLNRLRKDQLSRLYELAGFDDANDVERFTKSDLVNGILSSRPSSSVSPTSSNDAGVDSDAPADETPRRLRRRVTETSVRSSNISRHPSALRGRSFSMTSIGKNGRKNASSRSSPSQAPESLPFSPRKTRSRTRLKEKEKAKETGSSIEEEDDDGLEEGDTEDEEAEEEEEEPATPVRKASGTIIYPSPKRLRSRQIDPSVESTGRRRARLQRKVKLEGSMREPSTEPEEDEEEEVEEADVEEGGDEEEEAEVEEVEEEEEEDVEEKVAPPPPKKRRPQRTQTYTPPSDGDDDDADGDAEEEEDDDDDEEAEEQEDEEQEEEEESQGRVLRNGKVVVIPEIISEDKESVIDEDEDEDLESIPEDEGDMDEDIDLSEATAKTLARLKRDDLIRLCENRDLEAEGTKVQLVRSLLEWRDSQSISASSPTQPSSTSTARPSAPATTKPRHHPHPHDTPVLMRESRIYVSGQPNTPPVSGEKSLRKDGEDLELDLESLGLEDKEIPPDKLVKLEKIGSGGFKDVYIGKLRGRLKVAIAEFRGQLSLMDIKELKLLRDFDHPNVVRFLGVSIPENTKETPVMMVSELCANGDLFDYIRNVPAPSLRKILHLMLDISRGLEYLHLRKPSVIHRDCKSSNILITSKVTAKIADFGLAKVKQSTRSMVRSLVGTVNWQAPELWHPHPKYDHKVDVFSCALVFWEIMQWHIPSKKFPWEGMNEHAIYEAVGAKKQRPPLTGLRKQWCPGIVDLVEQMWSQEPQDRPTISEVVEELERLIDNI